MIIDLLLADSIISKPGALTKKDHLGGLDRQVWLYNWVGAISNFKLTYVMWALSASTGGHTLLHM